MVWFGSLDHNIVPRPDVLRNKTVFVGGAGASREVGLPTGSELKPVIADKLNIKYKFSEPYIPVTGDAAVAGALAQYAKQSQKDVNALLHEAWKIAEAMPQALSIDNFMDAHRKNVGIQLCGKLAIAQAILEAEANSQLFFDDQRQEKYDPKKLTDTWYENFFKLLTENVGVEDIETIFENISFVLFNYDRCVEHFLFHSLQNYYRIGQPDASFLLEKLKISHPYGSVGPLRSHGPGVPVTFGDWRRRDLLEIAGQIKTFTERVEDEVARDAIRLQIQAANTIVFLGFAFHPLNMELITPEIKSDATRIFGTAMGISDADVTVVMSDIQRMLEKETVKPTLDIHINNSLSCASLFTHYWRSLSRR
jgi:hypothetical protein